MKISSIFKAGAVLATLVVLAACATPPGGRLANNALAGTGASAAPPPRVVQYEAVLVDALSCFAGTRLAESGFTVGPTQDGTGQVDMDNTGRFLPDGSSPFIIKAFHMAGQSVFNFTSITTAQNVAAVGGQKAAVYMASQQNGNFGDYQVESKYSTLDFTANSGVDFVIGGFGLNAEQQGAIVTTTVEILLPGSQQSVAQSILRQYVNYSAVGITVGRSFNSTLATGGAGVADQQQIQFEASRLPMMIGVLDVLSQLPQAPQACKEKTRAILASKQLV